MTTAEVAVYPLKTSHASEVISNSINVLKNSKVDYSVNSMNTKLSGPESEVFNSLSEMFYEAERSGGEVNMVVTITSSC